MKRQHVPSRTFATICSTLCAASALVLAAPSAVHAQAKTDDPRVGLSDHRIVITQFLDYLAVTWLARRNLRVYAE